jgi:hypothetical protein
VRLTATLGASTNSATLVVNAPIISLQLNPSTVVSGNSTTGTVTLNAPAPARGLIVPLSASNASASVPASVTVPAGIREKTFQVATTPITTLTATGGNIVTIAAHASPLTAISDGTSNTILIAESTPIRASANLSLLRAVILQSVSVTVPPPNGGAPITLGLVFNGGKQRFCGTVLGAGSVNPVTAGNAQITVDQPALVHLPTSVTIPSDAATVLVCGTTTAPATDQNVTITTTFGSKTISTPLLLKAPPP